ncbi:MAG: hypothetical protein LBN07_00210 [Christensenellaceae bacterium]|jgi:transglutaminase-like putative cysteine protease|nr:hypothetical protein [Christensenellaceae bacterium]
MKKIRNGMFALIAVVLMSGFVFGGCSWFDGEGPEVYQAETFYMNGQTYDYVIDNNEELKMLVWHTILYRKNNVKFYLNYSAGDLNTQVGKFIYDPNNDQNTYPEYDGLNVLFYTSGSQAGKIYTRVVKNAGGQVWQLQNFTYYLNNDFTLSTANATASDVSHISTGGKPTLMQFRTTHSQPTKDHDFDMEYIQGTPDTRTFPIDDVETEVEVYNTTQLFMAAQYGAKPIFTNTTSVAYTVYQNARTILGQINNSDALTDYEKALNIYNYIVQNVTYDHVLFDYMDEISDDSVYSFGNFGVFHLEGVLYDLDDQVAVCDGLSKAFALMCRIEGIYSTKVNGMAGNPGAQGKHAWNEIGLDGEYHWVDTTWGMAYWYDSGTSTLYEYASRSYFLVDDNLPSHTSEFVVGSNNVTDYNYFEKLTVNHNSEDVSHLVGSVVQLNKLIEYYTDLASTIGHSVSFEIKLTNAGYTDILSHGGLGGTLSGVEYIENFLPDGKFVAIYVP